MKRNDSKGNRITRQSAHWGDTYAASSLTCSGINETTNHAIDQNYSCKFERDVQVFDFDTQIKNQRPDPATSTAANFVQRNENQLKKNVSAIKDIEKDQAILYGYENAEDQTKQVNALLAKLSALPDDGKISIFLLARYSHLKPKQLARFPNLDLKFSTIHASKGLQADYAILLNVETGLYGFPSTIEDDPLMELDTEA
jgi:superfamily I DNA/RNA helicase